MSIKWVRLLLIATGIAMMGYAVNGVIADWVHLKLPYLRYLIAVLIAHDLVVLPTAIVIGALIRRWLPSSIRSSVQLALFASIVMIVIGLPFALGFGRSDDLPSALPRNYSLGLLVVLGAIWAAVGLQALLKTRLRRANGHPQRSGKSR